ncbi:MAG TPA: guanitoxin biosynthesis L-enduracididine beta-hydroxylase GntD [Thermoanaerobaculia bacterium]|nr:guanitoxin biosynthesis L-enduracididine beta-hydroxylase GntD [Thermoanaerobaculia bacterium]
MLRLSLEKSEIDSIKSLVADVAAGIDSVEDGSFQCSAAVYAHELPRRVRKHLTDFKLHEPAGAICMVSGYPMEHGRIGPTPAHWKNKQGRSRVIEEEVLLVLLGSLLGDCIGWATQQDGYVVHDILPIKEHKAEQLGSGSEQPLWWHTEDAFHPYRGDYLGMMCLRNPDGVATTYATVGDLPLSEEQLDLLYEPHFTIRPDESHLQKNRSNPTQVEGELVSSYEHIEKMNAEPEKIAILGGDRRSPYIRIDPYFMDPIRDNERAQAALDALIAVIDQRIGDLVLQAGDFCFIDNFKCVHGRKPFKARFDGTDRWIKRINIVRDLRKSRTSRSAADSRIIV